tara:strand:+ start:647 stop:784 length:138 start_codon:yes stop_codon:yes gene_type:complete
MIKYKMGVDVDGKDETADLEDRDFLLITAIDNLSNEIKKLRLING